MNILHLERQILVWNKPSGVETEDPEALELLRQEINHREQRKGTPFLQPIHRLDQPTSGIVVFARSSKSLSRLTAALRERDVTKTYLAWVEGILEKEGELTDTIQHGSHKAFLDPDGKPSHLSYKPLYQGEGKTLLLIHLTTGRYHQIRLQFASRGYPIVGDVKYGGKKASRLLLHHFSFSIPHPITDEVLFFNAPLLVDFLLPSHVCLNLLGA